MSELFTWGDKYLEIGSPLELKLGNLTVGLERTAVEWSAHYSYAQDRYVSESAKEVTRQRTAFNTTTGGITLEPAMADRNVVVRPMQPIRIPDGQEITLYLSTPLWLRCLCSETNTQLLDIPTEILSDTWFGPNTREGEICYANASHARMSLANVPVRPERLISPVGIHNKGGDDLIIERLNVPIPSLSIYDTGASLWTQDIHITRVHKLEVAEIEFTNTAPSEYSDAKLISPARQTKDENLMVRALGLLF